MQFIKFERKRFDLGCYTTCIFVSTQTKILLGKKLWRGVWGYNAQKIGRGLSNARRIVKSHGSYLKSGSEIYSGV